MSVPDPAAAARAPGERAATDRPSGSPWPPVDDRPDRVSRSVVVAMTTFFLGIAAFAVASFVDVPYVIFSPGPATNTLGTIDGKPIIEVTGAQSHPAKGALDFTTVRVAGGPGDSVKAISLLFAWLDEEEDVFDRDQIFPPQVTQKQLDEANTLEMVDSQEVAAAVALRATGRTVPVRTTIMRVADDSPAKGRLETGDVLLEVDGTPITSSAVVRDAVRRHRVGDSVELVVERKGKRVEVTSSTRAVDGKAALGVYLGRDYVLPVDVKIHAGAIGGPSAGTMFALGTYDLLTPGDLTAGKRIAGTGTLDDSGAVGPIGGIHQKLYGARAAGAQWFLAPADNCNEVVGHVPDGLHVVRVATFSDALTAVRAIAKGSGGSLPQCTAATK